MKFEFDDDERAFADTLRRYGHDRLKANAARWDRGEKFPREYLKELAELGILGLRVPQDCGGIGASYVMAGIAAEELGRYDFSSTLFVQLGAMAADLLARNAREPVRKRYLEELARGDQVIALALTEPGAGSDAAALRTTARRYGDAYELNGEKASITFAGMADSAIVFARTGAEGPRGIGAFLVPLDLPGVTRQVYDSMGERLTQRGGLAFESVRVPAENLLGKEGGGFYEVMQAFDYNRAIIALACVGAATQSLEETIEYAKQRHTFGLPLAKREGVAFQIAEHLTMIEASRLIAYEALWKCDRGLPHTREAAMAKWLAPKAAAEAIHACIVLHGWIGYSREMPFDQRLRDVIGLEIGDGTPEIMKAIVAREAFGREFASHR